MTAETIQQLFERKVEQAKIDVRNARVQKELEMAKADAKIAAYVERLDLLENLKEIDWKTYAKNELEAE